MKSAEPAALTVAELAQALTQRQFVLHYQPIVELHGNRVIGAEALLRWQHPTQDLLPPGRFIPLAESSGLIQDLGAWVLDAACRQMRAWQALGWQPFRMAVNVSARQVGPDFDAWVKGILSDTGLAAEHLEIELTESAAFGDPAIFPILETLRQAGASSNMK